MKKSFVLFCSFFLLAMSSFPAFALDFLVPEKVSQGRGFLVVLQDNKPFEGKIFWNEKNIPFKSKKDSILHKAVVLLGMPIDASSDKKVSVTIGNNTMTKIIRPLGVKWVTHNLTVAPKYVEPPKEVLDKIKQDRKVSRKAMAAMSPEPVWKLPFTRPVKGTISGSFAARRVFNGQPRSPHLGTDMRGAVGTPIYAMASGTVLVAEEQYYSGNAVWIDHGQGVVSLYGHMSKFAVKKGDWVEQGQKIGEVGATGRVTGPHLHLSLYIQGVAVDAVPFFRSNPLEIIGGPTKEEPRPQPSKAPSASSQKAKK